ncbi:MAG TPA: TonB-dependent receptor, partial [Bryobacteraceae bacterium]|nr:TonB-dependent receptor [Bryobacteraceae bacterium]
NNYFASAPFLFDRRTVDSKVNWNASDKLSMLLRLSILRYKHKNPQMFGELAGPPVFDGSNPGVGDGGTYSTTIGGTYVFTPTFVLDAYFGYTRGDTSSQQPRLDEKLGLDLLKIPGTNGPRRIEGGWPRFQFGSGLTTVGINEDFMPYYRRDPQYQYVTNFNWNRGTHSLRFGMDLYNQHLNQAQPEIAGVALHGASGGFQFTGGPTAVRDGPPVNAYNAYAAFLLGLPTNLGRIDQRLDEFALRAWLYSFYVRDRWNVTHRLTLSYGLRYEHFPLPTRPDRGIERYDPAANKMLICGIGQVPRDCGVEVEKLNFAPRVGLAWRATDSFVVRAGYGITNDPFIAAEQLRANYPVLSALGITSANAFVPVGRLEAGIPRIVQPDLGNGVIDIPGGFAVSTIPQKYSRGYIQSWNLTFQKQLARGFVANAAYVGTREINKLGYLDINAGQEIGRGNAGRPLNQRFGRIGATTFIVPIGTGIYDALQTSLERRFSGGVQLSANYTWSKAIGYIDNSDSRPPVQALRYFRLNRALRGFDRTHVAHLSSIWELPFGRGRKWVAGGPAAWIVGGWQMNNLVSLMSGTPFTVQAPGTSLDMPGSTQTADQVKSEVAKLGGIGRESFWFDPAAYATPPLGRFGTSGFNSLRGPGLVNWDFGLFRQFAFTERWNIQFRMESFNFSNTPHFANPGNTIGDANFGRITGVTNLARENIDERQFRFGIRLGF